MNWDAIRGFVRQCQTLGIDAPPPLLRGLELVDVAYAHEKKPAAHLLEMTDQELRDHITALSIRQHDLGGRASARGMAPGIVEALDALAAEVRETSVVYLEGMIESLRPRFNELAAPLVDAAQRYGISYATTSDVVIDQDAATIEAFRAGKRAWIAVQPIASFRRLISTSFGLAPHGTSGVDFSVLFAEGENWGHGGRYYLEGKTQSHLDWYKLAAGGLRLNGLADVETKLAERQRQIRAKNAATAPETPAAPVLDDFETTPMPSYPRG